MEDKGAKMLESLIRLWAHQNNVQIDTLKITKKGKDDEKKNIEAVSDGSCSRVTCRVATQ